MNIQSAAEFLNISVRAVERLVKAKKIAVTYIEGKRNFSEVELTRFLEQKQQPVYRPAVTATQNDMALSQVVAPEYLREGLEYMAALMESAAGIAQASIDITQYYKLASVRSKMVLTLSEAAAISGLSKGFLNKHLSACNLPGKKIGRGWKIRPTDLEEFVEAIWAGLYESY